tara:strand:- start:572 stop:1228 length:657 start_codon:yes stop_codon:yes gene_type:complete
MITLLARDLKLSVRSGSTIFLGIAFFLIVLLLIPLSLEPSRPMLIKLAPGVLWIALILSCLLSLDRIFNLDLQNGILEVLTISPLPLEGIVLVKSLAHWITTCLPLIMLVPLMGLLYNVPNDTMIWMIISLLSGTPSLSVIGCFVASITLGINRGGLLLSLLVLPLYIPTLIFGTEVIRRSLDGTSNVTPLVFLLAISASSIALLPIATGSAIKINLN